MAGFLDLFEDVKKNLQCEYCSVMSLAGAENKVYACGRCSESQGSHVPATTSEDIASVMKFPCRYSKFGCNKQLSSGSVVDHEKACDHRVYDCIVEQCNFQNNIAKLKAHFKNNHGNIVISNGIFKLPQKDCKVLNVMFAYEEVFLVNYQYTSTTKELLISIKYIGKPADSGRFTYEMEMKVENSKQSKSVKVHNGKMKPFMNLNDAMDIQVTINSLENILKSPNIICCINIVQKIQKKEKKPKEPEVQPSSSKKEKKKTDKKEMTDLANNKVSDAGNDKTENSFHEHILREIECPVCQDYMTPPIFICTLGHSICSECKMKLSKCPTCSADYGNARNYALENMLQLVNYPCRNQSYGCNFFGNLTTFQQHKNCCKYDYINCPVPSDCNWEGSMELLPMHLKSFHKKEIFIKLDDIITHNLNVGDVDHNFIQYGDDIFRVSCKHGKGPNSTVQWSFQKLSGRSKKGIKMEIEFIDQTSDDRKFIFNEVFHDLTPKKDIFNNAVVLPLQILKPYINVNKLYFKYKIY